MKIYTKKGDRGYTTLAGGKTVTKNNARIDAYGTVDELIAHIGLLSDLTEDRGQKKLLLNIEDRLMVCASILASESDKASGRVPVLNESDVTALEDEIDRMEENLPVLMSFVLPGGHPLSSACHIARTVCRRAERVITALSLSEKVPEIVLQYMNRLSDLLFVLSRKILRDFKKYDIKWEGK